jgi:hypothetical protein
VKARPGALALEARNLVQALRAEQGAARVGPLAVSGMLAEQLAKELSAGAGSGAVVVSDDPRVVRAPVAIRIVAGDPSPDDVALVREAERAEIPVVIVQLWPQADWREPYVLSPFVVECKTGEGFPIATIVKLIATAADDPAALAARLPVLKETVEKKQLRDALVRAALLAASTRGKGAARSALLLEQVGLVTRRRALDDPQRAKDEQMPAVAVTAIAAIAASYGLREVARRARTVVPRPLSDAAVAVAGTWLLAEVFRRLEARGVV